LNIIIDFKDVKASNVESFCKKLKSLIHLNEVVYVDILFKFFVLKISFQKKGERFETNTILFEILDKDYSKLNVSENIALFSEDLLGFIFGVFPNTLTKIYITNDNLNDSIENLCLLVVRIYKCCDNFIFI